MENEAPYSNRELREVFSDIKGNLNEIKLQTQLTNGRVGQLENWKWFITGGLAILGLTIVPVLLKMFIA